MIDFKFSINKQVRKMFEVIAKSKQLQRML